jgi:hypothetical protein
MPAGGFHFRNADDIFREFFGGGMGGMGESVEGGGNEKEAWGGCGGRGGQAL